MKTPIIHQGLMFHTYLKLYEITTEKFAQYLSTSNEFIEILFKQKNFNQNEQEKIEYVLGFSFEDMKNDPYVLGEYQKTYNLYEQQRTRRIIDGEEILKKLGFQILK